MTLGSHKYPHVRSYSAHSMRVRKHDEGRQLQISPTFTFKTHQRSHFSMRSRWITWSATQYQKHCYFSHCAHSPGPHPTRSNPCYSSLHRSGCSSHSISWLAQCEGKEKREENLMLEKVIVSHTVKEIVIRVKI